MRMAERGIRQIARVTSEAWQTFRRGYSEKDVTYYKRVLTSDLTEEDRERYKRERVKEVTDPYISAASRITPSGGMILFPREGVDAPREETERLDSLSLQNLDEETRRHALDKLKGWGLIRN